MDFKSSRKAISPIQHQLEIELPWEEVEKRISDVVKEFTSPELLQVSLTP
jgi:hypothetical protein